MASFVRGLLAGLPRVNCWSIAEHAGENCPRGMQRLLSAAVWDEAGVRDDVRGYVLEHFADSRLASLLAERGEGTWTKLPRSYAPEPTQATVGRRAGQAADSAGPKRGGRAVAPVWPGLGRIDCQQVNESPSPHGVRPARRSAEL
jgi:hypothetical protein